MAWKRSVKHMAKRIPLFMLVLTLALPAILRAQGTANFSGNWKLAQIDPPVDPRNGRPTAQGGGLGGGGDADNAYGASIRESFAQEPQLMIITRTANQITVQLCSETESYA